jgi:hypothetical protein
MSLFTDASLVMVPSGYKTSKVYSVKPTDGSGDLTFTRSNDTATRIAPNGLIERVRTNVCLYSEQADNAFWGQERLTITANATTNPIDGATTADKMVADSSSNTTHNLYSTAISVTSGITYVVSAYFKKSEYDYAVLGSSTTAEKAWFNLTTGVKGTAGGSVVAYDMVSVGDGWYRCWAAIVTTSGSFVAEATIANVDGSRVISGVPSGGIFCFGFQLESGDIMTDYIATTSAAVSVGPVANLPRLDYLGSSCPSLLLEPQRTNSLTYSEAFDNAAWSKVLASSLANDTTSPDGYTNADKIRPNSGVTFSIPASGIYTAGASSYIRSSGLTLTAASYTFSAFVKKGEYDYIQLRSGTSIDTTANGSGVTVNLNNGTTTATSGYSIEDYGDGWYRISHTFTATATTWYLNFWFWNSTSVTANGTDGVYVYGAQLEEGAYSTSYIPTLGASVTRGADDCRKSNTFLSGQTVACAFVEYTIDQVPSEYAGIFQYRNNSTLDFYMLQFADTTSVEFRTRGTNGVENTVSASIPVGRNKVAMYRNGDRLAVFANGVKVADQTSGTAMSAFATTSENFYLNYDPAFTNYGNQLKVSQILLFAGQIFTDAQLAELTA